MIEFILRGILGGAFISLGGYIYLAVGGPVGAVLFSIGLLSVVHFGAFLYTGKIREFSQVSALRLLAILGLNVIGCILMTLIFHPGAEVTAAAERIVGFRAGLDVWSAFGRAVGCGIIMTAAVSAAKEKNNFWPLLIGVPGFILSGLIHSIADAFYISVAYGMLSPKVVGMWAVAVIGNFVGGLIPVWFTAMKNR